MNLTNLRDFVVSKIVKGALKREQLGVFPREIYEELYKNGFLKTYFPQKYGGAETTAAELANAYRILGYGSAGVSSSVLGVLLGMSPLLLYGTKKLQDLVFKAYFSKFELAAFCMTEKATGFDIINTKTKAIKVSGGYKITGEKNYITNGTHAHHLSVLAQTEGENGEPLGITVFYVAGDSPGVTRGPAMRTLGQTDSDMGELFFNSVFVPEENVIGKVGEGLPILQHCLARTKILMAAACVGMCDRALELVLAHLSSRTSGGKKLIAKSSIQQVIAKHMTEIEAAWALIESAATEWDNGKVPVKKANMAKLFAAEAAMKFLTEAVELIGVQGYQQDHEIGKIFRDIKGYEIAEGSTAVLEVMIGREIVNGYLKKQKPEEKPVASEKKHAKVAA